jgi:hypothetical protein
MFMQQLSSVVLFDSRNVTSSVTLTQGDPVPVGVLASNAVAVLQMPHARLCSLGTQ